MKKLLIIIAVILVVIGVATSLFLSNLDGLIKDTIETEGTAAVGTQVSLQAVETDLVAGKAVLSGLTVANVDGYQAANAIEISQLVAQVDYETQIIEEILIEQPVINAELVGTRSNFNDLIDNMPPSEAVEETDEEEVELTILSFKLNQATANVLSDRLGEMNFVMDDLEITNLSGTADQISEQITKALTGHIAKQVQDYVTEQFKAKFNAEALTEAKEKVDEVVKEKLGDKLKGLKLKLKKD